MKRIIVGKDDYVGEFVMKQVGGSWQHGRGTAIGLEDTETGELLGGVAAEDYNGSNCFITMASNGSKNWGSRAFIEFVFDYLFNQIGCRRVTGLVNSTNPVAIEINRKLGFECEAVLWDACPNGHVYVFRMLKEDCKWLKRERENG